MVLVLLLSDISKQKNSSKNTLWWNIMVKQQKILVVSVSLYLLFLYMTYLVTQNKHLLEPIMIRFWNRHSSNKELKQYFSCRFCKNSFNNNHLVMVKKIFHLRNLITTYLWYWSFEFVRQTKSYIRRVMMMILWGRNRWRCDMFWWRW